MLRRVLPWLGVVALVVAAIVTAGWGQDDPAGTPRAHRSPSATSTPSPEPAPTSLSFVEAHSLTRNTALHRRDLPNDFRPVRERDPYGLTGPSLDLCGADFDSERFRLAAHRVTFWARHGEGRVHNVVVAYERGRADQALAELEAAAARCTRPVRPGTLEQPDTLALRVRRTGPVRTLRRDVVVERRGDVLSVLQVDGRQGYLTLELARRLGNRLESQLP